MINLEAFHTLLAKLRLASTLDQQKRISLPGAFPVISVYLNASAPYLSITSSGSIPFPNDLLIFLPWSSLTRPWNNTLPNGFLPICSQPENIILITQKNIISYPVTSTSVGQKQSSSGVLSGQPSVENGHNADENHVSSVSGSCSTLALPHLGHVHTLSLETVISPQSLQQYAGILCPHQSCLEIHQSLILSVQL